MSDKGTDPGVVVVENDVVAMAAFSGTVDAVTLFPVGPLFSVHIAEKNTDARSRVIKKVCLSILVNYY